MPNPDVVDPTVEEADRRAERAKASLLARVEVLKQRVSEVKHKLDVPAQIARHPWPAVGVAFALGVAAGFGRKGSPAPISHRGAGHKRSVGDMVLTAAAALGIRLVRDAALAQVTELARHWFLERSGGAAGTTASEAATGGRADLEPFLEH